jgi:protocatechuate 3,4-dioxygenase beta subunit
MALPDSRLSMLLSPKTATTAPDGRFRIGGLTAGAYIVRLPRSSDRIGPLMPGAYVPPASPEKTDGWVAQPVRVTVRAGETKGDLKLQLTTGGFIEVLVKDDAGKPVPGATVSVFQVEEAQSVGGQSFSERTDEKGLARIRVAAGRYVVAGIYKQGFARRMGVIRLTDAFAVEEGETRQIEQVLGAGPKVAGIVRDEAGNALAGVKLNILPMMVSPNEVTSDASGKFEMAWDPGMWGPQGTTFILVARDEARGLAEAVDLDEQGGALDVKLRPGVVVTGTVLDQEGRPLPEARAHVILQGSRWSAPVGRGAYAKAGPDGKFEIKAIPPDRQYTVSATAEGFGRTDVRFDAGGIKDNRFEAGRLKLIPANLSIAGIVVDPNDQPVEGANIHGFGEGQPSSREVQTDAEGKFTLKGVCPGSIRLQVTSRGPMPMFGTAQVEGGATDLRIVISSRATPSAYMPRRPNALKGKPLPSLKDLGIDLPADAEGKMLLVCFWDMGQRPSRYCLTQLAAQAAQLDGKGVLVVAIHAAKVEDGVLTQWAQKNEVPFKMGIMTGDIDKTKLAWGVASLPHLILTDKKHTVIAEGFSPGDLDKQIEIAAAP